MKATPEQLRAIETVDRDVCVDAGAGSGKTGVLVGHIVHLLEKRRAGLDELVAITFTDKAASEMKDRLRDACRKRASIESAERMTFWRTAERQVDTARISTIHAFCMGILKQNALALGVDPDFAILPEAEAHLLRHETVESAVHRLLEQGDEAAMRLAVEYGTANVLIALHALLRSFVFQGMAAAAGEQDPEDTLRRWEGTMQQERRQVYSDWRRRLAALDGACSDAHDKREILRKGLEALCRDAWAATDTPGYAKALAALQGLDARGGSKKNWSSPEAFAEVKEVLDEIKEHVKGLPPPAELAAVTQRSAQFSCDLAHVYAAVCDVWAQAKAARASCVFDDLIMDTLHVLESNAEVRRRTAQGIKHLLIDEFQDTDVRQLAIARLLAREPDGPKLFIVGDAKQSIYRFRGAEVEVFEEARHDSEEHVSLDRNFRSIPDALAFVNDFFSRTGLLAAVEDPYRPIQAHREAADACRIELLLPDTDKKAPVQEHRAAEAELVAARIADMCAGPDPVCVGDPESGKPRSARFGDVAVLFRAMSDVYIYEKALRARGVPYTVVAGAGFYECQEVADLHNLLRVVIAPCHQMALLGLLRSPLVGLSDNTLVRLADMGSGAGFPANALDLPAGGDVPGLGREQAERLDAARGLLGDLRARREMDLAAFLRYVLDRTGYEAILLAQERLGPQKALNLLKVVNLADGFSRTRAATLPAFVRYLDDMAAQATREGEAALQPEGLDSVVLMTVHKSKGLEFPIVCVADMARGLNASGSGPAIADPDFGILVKASGRDGELYASEVYARSVRRAKELDQAEHARVLYVAMTRARDWLLLSGAPNGTKGSSPWLASLLTAFDLGDPRDGLEFAGEHWRACVRRQPGGTRVTPVADECEMTLDAGRIAARIAPVAAVLPADRVIPVTELAGVMAGEGAGGEGEGIRSPLDPLTRGTLAHELFESWDFPAESVPDVEGFVRRTCPDRRIHAEVAADFAAMVERFQHCPLFERLRRETAAQRETPFLLRIDETLVAGKVDLFLQDGTVIDYKTGRRTAAAHAVHEWQVLLYALAVDRVCGRVPAQALLCYVDGEAPDDVVCSVDVSRERLDQAETRARKAIAGLAAATPKE